MYLMESTLLSISPNYSSRIIYFLFDVYHIIIFFKAVTYGRTKTHTKNENKNVWSYLYILDIYIAYGRAYTCFSKYVYVVSTNTHGAHKYIKIKNEWIESTLNCAYICHKTQTFVLNLLLCVIYVLYMLYWRQYSALKLLLFGKHYSSVDFRLQNYHIFYLYHLKWELDDRAEAKMVIRTKTLSIKFLLNNEQVK